MGKQFMNKQEVYNFLEIKNIPFEIIEHKAVYNMSEISQINIPYKETFAKNLFVRDDKKKNYYLITIKNNKRANLKELSKSNQTGHLSFSSETDLISILGLRSGSVTPLGILNGKDTNVKFFLDKDFLNAPGMIGVHPNDNTATILLKTEDLINIISEHGNEVKVIKI